MSKKALASSASHVIFDSSDDFLEYVSPDIRPRFERMQKQVLSLADRVLCVNDHVSSKLDHRNKLVFRNCTDYDTFQRVSPWYCRPPYFPKLPNKRYIGFIGGLNVPRADIKLLRTLFRRFEDCQFLFVGYTNDPSVLDEIAQFPNAAFVPEVPYDELPNIIRTFDVAIVPHQDNEYTRGNDLLKVLDYFACAVPVVTTDVSGVGRYGHACHVAENHDQFAAAIDKLLRGAISHNPEPGRAIARRNTWRRQVPDLLPWIFAGLGAAEVAASRPAVREFEGAGIATDF